MYTQLDVVNEMLALLGELPVNDLLTQHPSVPAALARLRTSGVLLQSDMFWFNTEDVTLTPQSGNKRIVVPGDAASIDSYTRAPEVAVRGGYLYNLTAGTFEFDEPIKARLLRVLPFEQLPFSVRRWVAAHAKLAFQNTLDADANKTRELEREYETARVAVNAEHIRNKRVNMLNRPGVRYVLNQMQGLSPFSGRLK